jgi:LPS-assembly protein
MPRAAVLTVLIVALWLAHAPGSWAVDFGEGPVLLLADDVQYDTAANVVTATGDVRVERGERVLLADRLRYDQTADRIEAEGNVILLEPAGEAIFADRVSLSGDLKNGVADQLRARLTDDSLFAAARGRRIDGNRTEMERAVYSPCEVCPDSEEPPLWQIRARRVIHDEIERTVTYNHAFLELFGVPVAYTPYLSHPDPSVERKSGFLVPSFGNDSELGFTLETPYYFALAPNYDLTLAPIFTTLEGPVLTAEYRHLTTRGPFDLSGSVTYGDEAVSSASEQPDDKEVRGHLEGRGRFLYDQGWGAGYDLEVASDDTYLERYGFSSANVLVNRLYTERIWSRNYLGVNGFGFQGLRPSDDQGLIPIVLPLAEAALVSEPWQWGSRFTLDSSLIALTRTEGLDTRRLSTTGGWELPWTSPLGDQSRLELSLRGDVYNTDGNPQTYGENGTNTVARVVPRVTFDWSWPFIGDTFGLTPLLEPVFQATWAPAGVNQDDIPNEDSVAFEFDASNLFQPDRFPGLDQIDDGAHISYGLRFGAFGDTGELVSGLFGQSFRLNDNDTFPPGSGVDRKLSDYVGRIDFTPHDWMNISYRFRLDQDSLAFERNEIRGLLGPPRMRFDVTYLFLQDDPALDSTELREEIRAGVGVTPTPSFSFRVQTRRNLAQDQTVANTFGFVYRNPCLILVGGIERSFIERGDIRPGTTFSLRVTLKHLGEVGAETSLFGL